MKILTNIVLVTACLLVGCSVAPENTEEPAPPMAGRYQVSIAFYDKGEGGRVHKWRRTVDFRDEFHFFLDRIPLREGFNTGSIAGVLYPKNGQLHCTLQLWASRDLKAEVPGNSYRISEVKYLKVPASLTFELPLEEESIFQKCVITLRPK